MLQTSALAIGYKNGGKTPRVVANHLNLQLNAGEFVCLVGPNGVGKSTLLRTVIGLQPKLAGEIQLSGRKLATYHPRELANQVSVVLTSPISVGAMRVDELVAMGRFPFTGLFDRMTDHDWDVVHETLRVVGVEKLSHRYIHTLSDGERQKVMIARALAQEPRLLVLDEPTAYLDLPGRVVVMDLLHDLASGKDKAVLTSTHELDLALRHADRIWLMNDEGQISQGAPEDLVLNGSFAQIFNRAGVRFDPLSGSFDTQNRGSKPVFLEGQGPEAIWTRRALLRAGYRVEEEKLQAFPSISVITKNGTTTWQLEQEGHAITFASIYELLQELRN
ncbi:MAG TPA: ABC transporter ATP-binding protein [Anaerolineaceae bacterium]|nr:ABC transporter ATP-binding protein [Anaerolineaceae bacterium]